MTYEYYDLFTGQGVADCELYGRYDDMLDECYGLATVAGLEFGTARALKELDPIAYRCGFVEWVDGEVGESLGEGAPLTVRVLWDGLVLEEDTYFEHEAEDRFFEARDTHSGEQGVSIQLIQGEYAILEHSNA